MVEVLIATVILVIGLVAMAELMAVTLRLQQLGRNSTSAVRLAQDKIDELTTRSFTTHPSMACGGSITAAVANYNDRPTNDKQTRNDLAEAIVGKGYTRRWMVSAGPDGNPNLRQVTVRVLPDVVDRRTAAPYDLTTFIRGVGPSCP